MQARMVTVGGGVMLACFVQMASLEHFTRQGSQFVPLMTLAFVVYGLLAWRLLRDPAVPLGLIFALAILFRLPLLATTPTLSSDVWRYLWDGRLVTEGINPYAYRVDAAELAPLRTPLHARIDHQWMASPYPPVSQGVFALTYVLAPESALAMQTVFAVFDLLTALLLVRLLRLVGSPPTWVLLYAWNPLMVVEFAHGAHVDSLMTFFILLAIYAHFKGWQGASAVALALATLTKFIPAVLVVLLLRRWGWRNTLLYGGVVALAFFAFLPAGLNNAGTGIFGAARIYANQWKTNDGLFFWLVKA
ncbi:MAG: hypothetical protein HC915_13285, partial [Anaerolineae bacterium]|nr:hypothetical protein [Anaerolineae bacterium]